jgi:hypothetical protein
LRLLGRQGIQRVQKRLFGQLCRSLHRDGRRSCHGAAMAVWTHLPGPVLNGWPERLATERALLDAQIH